MAVAKYSGNMRQTGIGVKELKQLIKIGDRFDYTYESFSAEDFTDSSKPKKKIEMVEVTKLYPDLVKLKVIRTEKKIEMVEVTKLYPDLVKLKVIRTGKEMIVSYSDILLYSNKKSLQPFKEEKL